MLCVLLTFYSCTEELVEEDDMSFRVEVRGPETVDVDELITLTLKSSKPIVEVSRLLDNGTSLSVEPGTPINTLYLTLANVGAQQVKLRFTSVDNESFDLTYGINVVSGNAVKITRVVVDSFYRINETLIQNSQMMIPIGLQMYFLASHTGPLSYLISR